MILAHASRDNLSGDNSHSRLFLFELPFLRSIETLDGINYSWNDSPDGPRFSFPRIKDRHLLSTWLLPYLVTRALSQTSATTASAFPARERLPAYTQPEITASIISPQKKASSSGECFQLAYFRYAEAAGYYNNPIGTQTENEITSVRCYVPFRPRYCWWGLAGYLGALRLTSSDQPISEQRAIIDI